jgi:uncharacterized protein YggE
MKKMKLLWGISLCLFWTCFSWSAEAVRSVNVTGECQLMVSPDRGQIDLTVESLDKDVQKSTARATDTYNKLKKAVEKLKLTEAELSTAAYHVEQKISWENSKKIMEGYQTTMTLRVISSELPKFGDVIRAANSLEITNIGNLQTFMSLSQKKTLGDQCLKDAMLNAKEKANLMVSTLGSKLGKALLINEQESFSSYPNPVPYAQLAMSRMSDAQAAPEVTTAAQAFSKKIQVTFELL